MKNPLFKLLLTAACLFLTQTIGKCQTNGLPTHAEKGKCYAKCMVPDNLVLDKIEIPIYQGSDENIKANFVKDTLIVLTR